MIIAIAVRGNAELAEGKLGELCHFGLVSRVEIKNNWNQALDADNFEHVEDEGSGGLKDRRETYH